MNTLISIDVESDGPYPGIYSMICFGAVIVEPGLSRTFYGRLRPITSGFDPKALAISGFTREQCYGFPDPYETMKSFDNWIKENSTGYSSLISDNPAFDCQWMNYYFHKYIGSNPLGCSGRRIGDLYCGMKMDMSKNQEWKDLYRKELDHNPLNDAIENAKALLEFQKLGLKL